MEDTEVSTAATDDIVQQHALQIGTDRVSSWQLKRIKARVLVASLNKFDDGDLELALDGFAHALAIEKSFRWKDWVLISSLQHNIAASLHGMQQFDAAVMWYERCLEVMNAKCAFPPSNARSVQLPPRCCTLTECAQLLLAQPCALVWSHPCGGGHHRKYHLGEASPKRGQGACLPGHTAARAACGAEWQHQLHCIRHGGQREHRPRT